MVTIFSSKYGPSSGLILLTSLDTDPLTVKGGVPGGQVGDYYLVF